MIVPEWIKIYILSLGVVFMYESTSWSRSYEKSKCRSEGVAAGRDGSTRVGPDAKSFSYIFASAG
jgi:hypothetical protein